MTKKLTFQEREDAWYTRLLLCRESMRFLRKEIDKNTRKKLKAEKVLKKFDELDYEASWEDIDPFDFEKLVSEYKAWIAKSNDLYLRSERELRTLNDLGQEALKEGYFKKYIL